MSEPNDMGYCCPGNFMSNELTGICGCEHENEERLCRSRNPDTECSDECVCVSPYTRNSWGQCCGTEAYPN